jgi:HD-like signal output (HDOD) protein
MTESREEAAARLLQRISARGAGSLPAVARTMGEVTGALRSNRTSAQDIANLILKDVSLTNTLLRVVNSAFYRTAAGQRISTISRAVVTLGLEAVSNLLMSVRVFEHFHDRKGIEALKKNTVHALLTSIHARELARAVGGVNVEEAFVAGMLHNLGHLLVAFHLPEEMAAIEALIARERMAPEVASGRVLGATFRELGLGVAEAWNLPAGLRAGIAGWVETASPGQPRIGALVAFAADLSSALAIVDEKVRAAEIARIRLRYARHVPLGERAMELVLRQSEARLDDLMGALRVTRKDLEKYAPALFPFHGKRRSRPTIQAMSALPAAPEVPPPAPQSEMDLVRALEDISFALASDVATEDVLTMVLETLCRGLSLDSALLARISPEGESLVGWLALGERAAQLKAGFRVSLVDLVDPLSAAVRDQSELVVGNALLDERLEGRFQGGPRPGSLAFLPVVVRGILVGGLYVERTAGRPIGEGDLGHLRLLRNQVVMALRQAG